MSVRGRKPRNFSKYMDCVSRMPPLPFVYEGYEEDVEFDFNKSKMMQWIVEQPDVKRYLYGYIKQAGLVVYDKEEKLWHGIDYFKPKNE